MIAIIIVIIIIIIITIIIIKIIIIPDFLRKRMDLFKRKKVFSIS